MPFLSSLVTPIAKAVIPGVASWLGGKALAKPSAKESAAQDSLLKGMDQSRTLALSTGQRGMSFLDDAGQTLAGPRNYYQNILAGNQSEPTAALAPDIARIRGAQTQSLQTAANLAPRGGGRSAALFDLPLQANAQVQGLYNQARPQAAAGLLDLGRLYGGMGTSALGSSSQFSYAATGGANSLLNSEAERRAREQSAAGSFGNYLYDLIKSGAFKGIGKKKTPIGLPPPSAGSANDSGDW